MKQNNMITKTTKNNHLKLNLIPETMKTKMNFLKMAFMALALMGGTQIFAQVTQGQFPEASTGQITQASDLNGGLVTYDGVDDDADGTDEDFTALGGTVMFFRPTSENAAESVVELEATLTDGEGNSFSDHVWYRMVYDQAVSTENETSITTGTLSGLTNEFITITNLESGYNKFRVRGETGSSVSSCPSDEYQDVIVFVLPQLNVTPEVDGTELVYCMNDVPTGANEITLSTGTITADYSSNTNDYPKPGELDADADFTLTYDWYAVPQGGGATIQLGNTANVDLSTATNSLTPGTYEFYVDVRYHQDIRDENEGGVSRPYVVYGGSTIVTSQTVVVTDTPGTPTITVVGVDD